MKEEIDLLIKLINLWWVDYYRLEDDFPDSAFIRFQKEINTEVFRDSDLRVKYVPQEDKWIFKPISND